MKKNRSTFDGVGEAERVKDQKDQGAPGGPILARAPTLAAGQRSGVPLGHSLTVEFKTPDMEGRGRRPARDRRPSFMDSESVQSGSPVGSRRLSTIIHDDRRTLSSSDVRTVF